MAANLQSTDFKETFIEKLQRENIGEYRSIRLDEWKQGDKVHRKWTYINCSPLDSPDLVNASSTKQAQSTESLKKNTGNRSDPPSPVVRKRKQERILEEEQFEINEELKRQKERLSREDEREKRKQERMWKQEQLEIEKEVKHQMRRLEKVMKGGALDRKQERTLKQEQLEIDADLKREKERLKKEGITSKPRDFKEFSPRQLQGQSLTERQESKQEVNAAEHITNLVNEDPEVHRLWMDMVNNVRDATNNLRYCQKNIGEKRLPGVNEGLEQMEEICRAVDQLTHVVIRKKFTVSLQ